MGYKITFIKPDCDKIRVTALKTKPIRHGHFPFIPVSISDLLTAILA